MFPEPDNPKPIAPLELLQFIVAPEGVETNAGIFTLSPEQTLTSEIGVNTGLSVIVSIVVPEHVAVPVAVTVYVPDINPVVPTRTTF